MWGRSGTEATFKDTASCRALVLDYTCLAWAGKRNRCAPTFAERPEGYDPLAAPGDDGYDDAAPAGAPADADGALYPRPPCRQFCTRMALECAWDWQQWIETCEHVKCPPSDMPHCTLPMGAVADDAALGMVDEDRPEVPPCTIYRYVSPKDGAGRAVLGKIF